MHRFLIFAAWLLQTWILGIKTHILLPFAFELSYPLYDFCFSHLLRPEVPYHIWNQSEDVDLPATWHMSRRVERQEIQPWLFVCHKTPSQTSRHLVLYMYFSIFSDHSFLSKSMPRKLCQVCQNVTFQAQTDQRLRVFVSGRGRPSRALAKRRWCCGWRSPPLWRSKLPEAKQNEAWRNSVARERPLGGLTLWSLDEVDSHNLLKKFGDFWLFGEIFIPDTPQTSLLMQVYSKMSGFMRNPPQEYVRGGRRVHHTPCFERANFTVCCANGSAV